mmetsp:Transcript_19241/g.24973  ORF Transcript_19241/g.24973 Transcript_19241/m.24973 type:complete len:267 (+) Transcript_19241:113-913(+)
MLLASCRLCCFVEEEELNGQNNDSCEEKTSSSSSLKAWIPPGPLEFPYMKACDDLPFFSCEFRGVGGVLKQRCSDFIVTEIMDEIPKLCPDADRNYHYWLKVKRTNKTTLQVVADLRQILGVDTIGYAGLKDKRAIATQTFSILSFSQTFERELDYKKDFEPLSKKGIEIIDISKSRYKLKQCMHQGNYFEIILADCSCNMEDIHSIAALIRAHGFPNYYGPQRFSKRCGLAVRGARIISEISAARRRAHFGTVKKIKKCSTCPSN